MAVHRLHVGHDGRAPEGCRAGRCSGRREPRITNVVMPEEHGKCLVVGVMRWRNMRWLLLCGGCTKPLWGVAFGAAPAHRAPLFSPSQRPRLPFAGAVTCNKPTAYDTC